LIFAWPADRQLIENAFFEAWPPSDRIVPGGEVVGGDKYGVVAERRHKFTGESRLARSGWAVDRDQADAAEFRRRRLDASNDVAHGLRPPNPA
jgi:hypothetical protein